MYIQYSQGFKTAFQQLPLQEKILVRDTIALFRENPHDPFLKNHTLKKPMSGKRSLYVDDDLRIIFREKGEYIEVLMLDVGPHKKVYIS